VDNLENAAALSFTAKELTEKYRKNTALGHKCGDDAKSIRIMCPEVYLFANNGNSFQRFLLTSGAPHRRNIRSIDIPIQPVITNQATFDGQQCLNRATIARPALKSEDHGSERKDQIYLEIKTTQPNLHYTKFRQLEYRGAMACVSLLWHHNSACAGKQ
jgi:hypothetical protein